MNKDKKLNIYFKLASILGDASKYLIGIGCACLLSGYVSSVLFDFRLNKLNKNKRF